ncbi:MAG: hypothetical protein JWO81_559 [Alphaproteobacteria bacterium]|nr:hypothetical protein [Alphaproteobacteria bacterium]
MKRLTLLLALVLAGCAHDAMPKTVLVPTPVPCIKGDLPAPPEPMRPLTGNAEADIATIAAQALRWRAYAEELAAIAQACRG